MALPERRVRSRLLPPPRSPTLTEISRGLTNSPRFRGGVGPGQRPNKQDPNRYDEERDPYQPADLSLDDWVRSSVLTL
jgi:hypothetical protein